MSAAEPAAPRKRRTLLGRIVRIVLWTLLIVAVVLGLLSFAVRWAASGGLGAGILASRLNGMELGGAGELRLRGFEGDLLDQIRAERIELLDDDGAWLTLTDVVLDWEPRALFSRTVRVEEIAAASVTLHRQPNVTTAPRVRTDGEETALPDFGVVVESLRADALEIQEDVFGRAQTFELAASAALRRDRSGALHLQAIESEGRADNLTIDAGFEPGGEIVLEAQADSQADGLIATLLGAPAGRPAALAIAASGTTEAGDGEFALRFAADRAADGTVTWTPDTIDLQAQVAASRWPALSALTERAGAEADLDLTLTDYRSDASQIDLTLRSERLDATIRGSLPTAERLRDEGLSVEAELRDLGVWSGGALEATTASVDAQVTRDDDGVAIAQGTVTAQSVEAFTISAERMSGPTRVTIGGGAIGFEAELTGQGAGGANALTSNLIGDAPVLSLEGEYDGDAGRLVFSRLAVQGAETDVTAEADIGLNEPRTVNISGEARNAPLGVIVPSLSGVVDATFEVDQAGANQPMQIHAGGDIRQISGAPEAAAPFIGEELGFEVQANYAGDTFTLERGEIDGPRIRAGAMGTVSPSEGYGLEFEAAVQGPVPAGPAELAGEALARGTVTGPMEAPEIEGQLFADALTLAGARLERPVADLRVSMADGLSGEARLEAQSTYGPATARASFQRQGEAIAIPDLSVDWADLSASGGIDAGADGLMSGQIMVTKTGEEASPWPGVLDGQVTLSGRGGEQYAEVTANAADLAFPESQTWIDSAELTASGPLSRLDYSVTGEGVLRGAPVTLDTDGVFSADAEGQGAEFDLNVQAGDVEIATSAPVTLALGQDGSRSLRAALQVDSGGLNIEYDSAPDGALIVVTIDEAPASLANVTRPEPRLDGALDASVRIDTRGGGMTGSIEAQLTDARAADGESEVIDADLSGTIANGRLQATLDLRGEGGFQARAEGGLPLERTDGFVPVRVNRDADLSAQLNAEGPIATLTALLLGPEQRLEGELDLSASLSGTPGDPRISGDGGLSQGRFDDQVSGLVLRDLGFTTTFSNDEVRIADLSAHDGSGGQLSGSGFARSTNGEWGGEVTAMLNSFQVVNRSDAEAVISGELSAVAEPDRRSIEGDLRILQGEFAPPQGSPPGVRTLEVTEINLPAQEEQDARTGQRRGPPIQLDIRVSADRRLFVRSGNMNIELSLDTRISGTASDPSVDGVARVVRGDADLASRRFEVTDGRVEFNGEPLEAEIDVTAVRDTTALTAIIHVTGTPREPRIELSSRPPLPEDEVLSQVLFGRSVTDLSVLEAAQLASGLAGMTGGGGFNALGNLRSGLGLDRLSVGRSEEGDPLITGGRYLTDDVYLELSTAAGESATAQVEWQVLNDFAIISRFGSYADTSVSVRWRTTY